MADTSSSTQYTIELQQKHDRLHTLLAPFNAPEIEIYASQPEHYRVRAEFRVWHEGDDLYHIMFDSQTKERYRVDQFAAASKTINAAMQEIMSLLKDNPVMRRKLFQIDYLSGLSEELVISLLYHKPLDEQWKRAAAQLQQQLRQNFKVNLIGRARKQKEVLGNDFIIEQLPVNHRTYEFKHIENSFTQPNAKVNCDMIEWALKVCGEPERDLLELYCGAGNFSLPMASQYRKVIGTEIAKPSVTAAQFNIARNNITNVDIVRLAAEDFTVAMRGEREFKRLEGINLSEYDFATVLVDPPRAGLDDDSLKMIQDYEEIVYISCNPDTLSQNLTQLCKTHRIEAAALFDQFPFTHHIETGVKLVRIAK